MSKITKTIAALGVVAGLGVAALPLASYAIEDTGSVTVNATIGESIDLTVANGTVNLDGVTNGGAIVDNSTANTTTVTVKSNGAAGYKLTMSADETTLKNTAGDTIEAGTPTVGTSAWGYKFNDAPDWTTFAGNDTLTTTSDADATADGTTYNLVFGVSANNAQAAGTYTNTFTLTATTN